MQCILGMSPPPPSSEKWIRHQGFFWAISKKESSSSQSKQRYRANQFQYNRYIYIHIYCRVQLVGCNSTFHSHPHYCGVRCFVSFQGTHGVAHLSPAQRTGTESRIFEPKIYPAWYSPTACNAPSSIHIDRNTLINKRHINSDSCYDIRRS